VAYRSRQQLAHVRRIESVLRVVSPALNMVLFVGDRASRVVGRNQIGPEPARRPRLPSS
jgi:hypothetical protein